MDEKHEEKPQDEPELFRMDELLNELHGFIEEQVDKEIAEEQVKKGSLGSSAESLQAEKERKVLAMEEDVKRMFNLLSRELKHAILLLEDECNTLSESDQVKVKEECSRLKELFVQGKLPVSKDGNEEASLYEKLHIPWPVMQSFYAVGYNLFDLKRWQDAAEIFQMLTMLSPFSFDFWMALGLARHKHGDSDAALAAFVFASLLEPGRMEPVVAQVEEHLAMNNLTEATSSLAEIDRAFTDQHPQYKDWHEAVEELRKELEKRQHGG